MDDRRGAVSVTDLAKEYVGHGGERVRAVDTISFEVNEGEFYTLLGPSGCGKTTTLRCLAGLERSDEGTIVVGGTRMSSHRPDVFVPPHKRDIGMVFQSYAIWPHLTVFENVAFPLRVGRQRVSGADISKRVEEALGLVQLERYAGRMATQLSGGQQQRLALARAIVRQPKLLLLDEPLSNLDAKLREHMRAELRSLQQRLGLTTVYVTHDQIEALAMSSRIALMSNGRIEQEGRPRELYQRPASQFVATFIGSTNLVEATVLEPAGERWLLESSVGRVESGCPAGVQRGDRVALSLRPESLSIHAEQPGTGNVVPATVELSMFLGDTSEYHVRAGGSLLRVREHPNAVFRVGDRVFLRIPYDACTVISDEYGVAAPEYQDDIGGSASSPPPALVSTPT